MKERRKRRRSKKEKGRGGGGGGGGTLFKYRLVYSWGQKNCYAFLDINFAQSICVDVKVCKN